MKKLAICFNNYSLEFFLKREDIDIIICKSYFTTRKKIIFPDQSNISIGLQQNLVKELDELLSNFDPDIQSFKNLIFDFALMPIYAYTETLKNHLDEEIEVFFYKKTFFPSNRIPFLLGEGESRGSFLFFHEDYYQTFIANFCKENNIGVSYIKSTYLPFSFLSSLKIFLIFTGKLLEDIYRSFSLRRFQYKNELPKNERVVLTRSFSDLFENTKLGRDLLSDSNVYIYPSSSLSVKKIKKLIRSKKRFGLISYPNLKFILSSYFRNIKSIAFPDPINDIAFNPNLVDLNAFLNVIREINCLRPSLNIYREALALTDFNSKNFISLDLKSPEASIQSIFCQEAKAKLAFYQSIDINPRVIPELGFGNKTYIYSKKTFRNLMQNNPSLENLQMASHTKNFKLPSNPSILKEDIVLFFDSDIRDMVTRNEVVDALQKFALINSLKLRIHPHPRDNSLPFEKELYVSSEDLDDVINVSRFIFTFPSAVIKQLIDYDVVPIILFVGFGNEYRWHYSYHSDYPGCVIDLEEIIAPSFIKTIKLTHKAYRKRLIDDWY